MIKIRPAKRLLLLSSPLDKTKVEPLPKDTAVATRSQSSRRALELAELIVDSIQDVKGKRLVRIDLREVEDSPADFFVICEGESNVQIRAIAENVRRRTRAEMGERVATVEGLESSTWVCLDYFDAVVHIFSAEARGFYDLESLWGDAPSTEYEDV